MYKQQCSVLFLAVGILGAGVVHAQESAANGRPGSTTSTPRVSDVKVEHEPGSRKITLPPGVRASRKMNCGDNRVIRLAGSDVQAKAKPGDVSLIFYASEKDKELVLNGASCQADGSILVETVSIEPDVSVPVDICALPMAKEKLARCR